MLVTPTPMAGHAHDRDPNMDVELLEQVLAVQPQPQLELGTRYATDGIPRGATPLYVAVARGNLAAVELLLDRGASPVTHCLAPPELDTPAQLGPDARRSQRTGAEPTEFQV